MDWYVSEFKQLNQHHAQEMFGENNPTTTGLQRAPIDLDLPRQKRRN